MIIYLLTFFFNSKRQETIIYQDTDRTGWSRQKNELKKIIKALNDRPSHLSLHKDNLIQDTEKEGEEKQIDNIISAQIPQKKPREHMQGNKKKQRIDQKLKEEEKPLRKEWYLEMRRGE